MNVKAAIEKQNVGSRGGACSCTKPRFDGASIILGGDDERKLVF
jgi:hypothetical protein